MEQDRDQVRDSDRREAGEQDERRQANARTGEQQGQHPFLKKISEVQRQGVPEPGAVNPGPPPKPVRSGSFHVGPVPPDERREER